MKKSRFTATQIVSILKQADAGIPVKDICRQAGISAPTYYKWKAKYGGMEASDLKRVKVTCPLSQGHLLLSRVQVGEHTAPVGQISIGG